MTEINRLMLNAESIEETGVMIRFVTIVVMKVKVMARTRTCTRMQMYDMAIVKIIFETKVKTGVYKKVKRRFQTVVRERLKIIIQKSDQLSSVIIFQKLMTASDISFTGG